MKFKISLNSQIIYRVTFGKDDKSFVREISVSLKKKPLQLFHDKPGKNPDYSLINIWLGHPCSTRPPLAPKMVLFARYHLEWSMYSTRLSHAHLEWSMYSTRLYHMVVYFYGGLYKAGHCYCLTSLITYDIHTHSCSISSIGQLCKYSLY